MNNWLEKRGIKKKIIQIFNDRILDWRHENVFIRSLLPIITEINENDFTFEVRIFQEINPSVNMVPIELEDGTRSYRADIRIITPNYKDLNTFRDCITFLGDYFDYDVFEMTPLEDVLLSKEINPLEINEFMWQIVKFRFKKRNKIKKFENFK